MRVDTEQRESRDKMLDVETQSMMLSDWVKVDSEQSKSGQLAARKWNDMPKIGDEVLAFETIGTVVNFGKQRADDGVFEHCVWIKFPGGEIAKAGRSETKVPSADERKRRRKRDERFEQRLQEAGKKVQRQRKEKRARMVAGSHLVDDMVDMVKNLDIKQTAVFYKITGNVKKRAVYLAIKGGRVDLSGFCVEHEAITPISETLAKEKHLGRVRGQIDFTRPDSQVLDAFAAALSELKE